jgi:hypothetical protein
MADDATGRGAVGDRRQETGDRRPGDRRPGDRRQETGDRRPGDGASYFVYWPSPALSAVEGSIVYGPSSFVGNQTMSLQTQLAHFDTSDIGRTKLGPPQLRPRRVTRPSLLARLDAGLGGKLMLVSAPAGFGKTTLVADWLAERQPERAATQHRPDGTRLPYGQAAPRSRPPGWHSIPATTTQSVFGATWSRPAKRSIVTSVGRPTSACARRCSPTTRPH